MSSSTAIVRCSFAVRSKRHPQFTQQTPNAERPTLNVKRLTFNFPFVPLLVSIIYSMDI